MKFLAFVFSAIYCALLAGVLLFGLYYAMPWLLNRGWFTLLLLQTVAAPVELGLLYLFGKKLLHNWRDISKMAYAIQIIIAITTIIAMCILPWYFRNIGIPASIAKCVWIDILFVLGSLLWFIFYIDGDDDYLLANK